nr:hypothetical protein [Tanacetum cinerariifolium]
VDLKSHNAFFLFTHGVGDVLIGTNKATYEIPSVSFVPNVLSLHQLACQGFEVQVSGTTCVIRRMFEEANEEMTTKEEVEIPLKSLKGKRLNNDDVNSEWIMWAGLDIDSDQDTFSGNKDTRQLIVNSFNYKKKWDEVSLGFEFSGLYRLRFKEIYVDYLLILETYFEVAKVGLTSTYDYIRENCLVTGNNEVSMMLEQVNEVDIKECHGRTEDTKKENISGRAEYHGRTGPMTADTKKENMTGHAKRHRRTEPMTTDTKKENMSGHAKRHRRTEPMTTDTKKENMSGCVEYRRRMGPMTADTRKENISGHAKRHRRTEPMIADSKKENMTGHAKRHRRTEPMIADSKKENMTGHAERHGRTDPMTVDTKKEDMSGRVEHHERTDPMTADTKKENMVATKFFERTINHKEAGS